MNATALDAIPNTAAWPSPAQIAERLGVTYGTLHAWLTKGVKTHAGRLKLPALKVGGAWRIDPAGVESFLQKLTTSARGEEADPTPPPESATRRRARAKAARDRLREMGVID